MERFINFELIKNPVNWVIVWLMLAIAGAAIALVFTTPAEIEE